MNQNQELPDLLSVKETAAYIRSPQPSVYFLIKEGKIPAVRIGGRWKVKRRELDVMYGLGDQTDQSATRALIVEDDPAMRRLYEKALGRLGIQQHIVESGQEALVAAADQDFDIAFLDLILPDLTGEDVFKGVKKAQPDLPVVIVTGYPDSEMLSRILATSPAMVLKKPIDLDQLQTVVKLMVHPATEAAA